MAAYGAAVSLKNTIQRILQSPRISLVSPSPQILQQPYDAMCHLQKVLLRLEETGYNKIRTEVNALNDRIKAIIWEFEDLLESHVSDQILAQLESERDDSSFSVDLVSLWVSFDCFVKRMRDMEAEYDIELANMPEEEGEPLSSRIDFGGINSYMVGLSAEFERVRDFFLENEAGVLGLIGMAGVGKTTLAKKVFDDPSIQRCFELRAWVKVGRKCESNDVLRCILAQLDPSTQVDDDDEKILARILEERLKDKICFIILDDIWEWDNRMAGNLPQHNVRILYTSRLGTTISLRIRLCLLDEEESKKLLGEKVFGEEGFPPHLEKLGDKIAKKCEGLPLMIVKVSELLSKEDKTPEFWTEVAEKQHNFVFEDAYDQISEVLLPSYDYLPQYWKMIFLYLGAFPPYSNLDLQTIFNLMHAECFLEPFGLKNVIVFGTEIVESLVFIYHLILCEVNPISVLSRIKFHVHSCWQHLCRKEASKIKFLRVLQSCNDVMKDQRRLGAHSNALFAFKQVSDSIKSDCAATIRSLLFLGPYHQFPVSIPAMDYKLLWVLDAFNVRFYHVPLEILKLVCLKYLSLTCNNELPISISNLFQLQTLNIGQHMNIKKHGVHSYVPVEIWNMLELQYIEILGRELPTPNSDATLDKLIGLHGVSANSCSREVLQRIPNLQELLMCMELTPYDDDHDWFNAMTRLGYISKELQNLERLIYVVTNPEMKYEFMVPLGMFPSSLIYLQLSGLGCPWEYINDICSLLPNLEALTLRCYAFRGPECVMKFKCFLNLERLVIEDTDLVRWTAEHESLPKLGMLSILHCYKFKQLYWACDPSTAPMPTIELVDCSPSVISSAMQLLGAGFKVDLRTSYLR